MSLPVIRVRKEVIRDDYTRKSNCQGISAYSSAQSREKASPDTGERWWDLGRTNTGRPLGAEGLIRLTIEPLMETQIDTLYWQLGTDVWKAGWPPRFSDRYSHNTKVGNRWGSEQEKFSSAGHWRIYENTRQLIAAGTDPAEVVVESGHERGLEVFLSMRVNDYHDGIPRGENPALSPMNCGRLHPDWLLGAPEKTNAEFEHHGISRDGYNFLVPEVRAYKLALAEETIANYDLDGLDWDFCRWPRLFPGGRQRESKQLLTDLIRQIKAALEKKSKKIGRKLRFSVRVPPTFELALGFGIDVRTWLEEGLVDILVPGAVNNMQRLSVEGLKTRLKWTSKNWIAMRRWKNIERSSG